MKTRESKETLGSPESHPSLSPPHPACKAAMNSQWNLIEHIMSPGLYFPLKEDRLSGAVEPLGWWVFQEICSGGTSWKKKFHIPCKLWAFCSVMRIWTTVPDCSSVWGEYRVCGWAGGWRGCLGKCTDLYNPTWVSLTSREGRPCAATPGNSQRGRAHRHTCLNKQRWEKLAVLMFHPDSFFSRDCMEALWLEWLIVLSSTWNAYISSNHCMFAFTQNDQLVTF